MSATCRFNREIKRFFFLFLLGFSASVSAATHNNDSVNKITPNDLYYKEILFYFYQSDYFSALIHALAANQQGRLGSENKLLEYGLKLSFGIMSNASMPLSRSLDIDSPIENDQNRLWFYFGKIYHQRGYEELAYQAFKNISMPLSDLDLEAERQMYIQKSLIQKGHDEAMFSLIKAIKPQSKTTQYIDYNLAMVYLDKKETAKAMRILSLIIKNDADEETRYVADKARLALARLALQNHLYGEAMLHLDHIHKDSSFYTEVMALKSFVYLEAGDFLLSSNAWDMLYEWPDLDPKALKIFFSLPYYWFKKGDEALARSGFEKTVVRVVVEKKRLQEIKSNLGVRWLENLLKKNSNKSMGWFWVLDAPHSGSDNPLLREKMNSHRMHGALSNYRELNILESNLLLWKSTLPIYAEMLDQRRALFIKNVAVVNASIRRIDKNYFFNRLQNYRLHIYAIEKNTNALALLSADEKTQWNKLHRLEKRLHGSNNAGLQQETAVLKGLFLWQQYKTFHDRLWVVKKQLKDTEKQIEINQILFDNLSNIEYKSVQFIIQFSSEIKSDRDKVDAFLKQVEQQKKQWSEFILQQLKDEIDRQIKTLDRYAGDARFFFVYLDEQAFKSLRDRIP